MLTSHALLVSSDSLRHSLILLLSSDSSRCDNLSFSLQVCPPPERERRTVALMIDALKTKVTSSPTCTVRVRVTEAGSLQRIQLPNPPPPHKPAWQHFRFVRFIQGLYKNIGG
ncbi:hypothetical protein F2P81_024414 [Scophthalmus maximus]|uniref:Uncharacterized protein n=1 Tax=Scophthalmus maximus TaxID=52904 RepID=A0A6A4RZI3_SCOMX|nr:hypothetical protein F2P81_024414 [Scophthalmus maximus]